MSVEQNVGYGLRLRKLAAAEIGKQVDAMLELVGLAGYNTRMPHELSGGQQQRVQLARSLVLDSAILLLDEPLAALDAKLRKSMCYELKRIQEQVGITFVHVTHNQEEAMTIADRIAVMANGELLEEGTVRDVYERPQRRFTADFIGDNTVLNGTVQGIDDQRIDVDLGFAVVTVASAGKTVSAGQHVAVSIRPEVAGLTAAPSGGGGLQSLPAVFIEQIYLGFSTTSLVRFANGQEGLVRALSGRAEDSLRPGQKVSFVWPVDGASLHID
jgi:ABC-type Fe3+/spermidine/putrescine transport system ATPase subunit